MTGDEYSRGTHNAEVLVFLNSFLMSCAYSKFEEDPGLNCKTSSYYL